jgi:putative SOS response-associated peptidase YedK
MSGTVHPLANFAPSWNVPPTQGAVVVRRNPDTGRRHLDLLKWGLAAALDEGTNQVAAADQRVLGDGREVG